jgi:hypothetical protein
LEGFFAVPGSKPPAGATITSTDSGNTKSTTIQGGTITTNDLQATAGTFKGTVSAGTVTGSAISGGTISGTAISGGTISGGAISGGTISGVTISGGSLTSTHTGDTDKTVISNGTIDLYDGNVHVGMIDGGRYTQTTDKAIYMRGGTSLSGSCIAISDQNIFINPLNELRINPPGGGSWLAGYSGSVTISGKTITVTHGIITNIA